jgi:hypothetical protein
MLGPIPYPFLGIALLAVVWTAALLCALASVDYARKLMARARELRGVREGTVASGEGPGGALAVHEVEQIGRAMDGEPPAIVFSDKAYRGEVYGGTLTASGETVEVTHPGELEVWPDMEAQVARAAVPNDAELDALYKDARSAKGAPRVVRVPFAVGNKVYFASGPDGRLTFLSAEDPAAFLSGRVRAHIAFAFVELAICGALTALALHAPVFGKVSTLGGAGLLAFFLIVQPVGVSVEEASREPFRRFLRGVHKRSAPFPGGVVPGRTTTRVEG